MRTITVSLKVFIEMLPDLIKVGVTFEASELTNGNIRITFTGGY